MNANLNKERLASTTAAPLHAITVITSTGPARVGKTYSIGPDGKLAKKSVASIWQGRATTLAATPETIVAALEQAAESENQVIALDSFIGAAPGLPAEINIVTMEELERLTGGKIVAPAPEAPGYFDIGGKLHSARVQPLMQEAGWTLFDADSPEGMPDAWRRLTLAERLAHFDRPGLLPGVSKCLRVEYRGSSARVVNGSGEQKPGATHALIQIDDPAMLETLRLHVRVQSVVRELAFKSPRYSKTEPGKIIGYVHLTLFDWSVWVLGRLVFNAKPDVSEAPGYRVLGANVKLVNPKGGPLDVGWIKPPDAKAMGAYRAKTGCDARFSESGKGGFALHEYGTLQLDTEIEAGGTVKPLADWLIEMLDGDIEHLRCEAPFRASVSEAAFIRIAPDGAVFVHDSGMTTNYYLDPLPQTEDEAAAKAAATGFGVYEMTAAVIEARTRQRQRQARTCFTALTDDEIAASASASKRPSLDNVRKAAEALKEGDAENAKAVFDLLVEVKDRTRAGDDIIVGVVKNALGKTVTVKTVRGMLKDAEARLASERGTLREASFIWPDTDGHESENGDGGPPRGFRETDGWMRRRVKTEDGVEWRPICSALAVVAMLRDGASSSWGLFVHFEDADGRPHDVPLPAEVYGDPVAVAMLLTGQGLRLADASPQTRAALSTMLTKWSHPERRTVAETPGWTHDFKAFVLRDGRTIGDQSVVLGRRSLAATKEPASRGSANDWKVSVAALCAGNTVLLTSVSASFAPVLLEPLNIENGVLHFRGNSGRGKTTALRAAVSVWGPPDDAKRSWRATANGLEGLAAAHNSCLLTLDELHQIAAKEAGPAALMIANGEGKTRADQRGESRQAKKWRLLALSSGECSLADRITAAAGEGITAGQEVRFIDLKVDERAFGCFDDLHGVANGKAFADQHVAAGCAQAYGTAGPAFVEFVMRTPDIEARATALMAKFEADAETSHGLAAADAQVTRGLRRFAVIAAAGELATEAGITGWPADAAAGAALEMFGLWIGGRGGLMSALDRNVVANTRAFLIRNDARFQDLVPDGAGGFTLSLRNLDRPVHNLVGWKDPDGFWIAADAWRTEIHAGVDGQSAARVLKNAGLLEHDIKRGNPRLTRRGPRVIDRAQCYYVKKAVLAAEEGL